MKIHEYQAKDLFRKYNDCNHIVKESEDGNILVIHRGNHIDGEFDPDEIAEEETKGNSIYVIAEEVPMFPGDFMAMERFLSENIRYPQKALKEGLEGNVVVEFVVEKDGSLTNIRVIRGVAPCLDEEALRVVKMMPKWKPGRQHHRIKRCVFRVPIYFNLPSKEKE